MSDPKTPELMRYAGLATQWMVMLLLAVWLGIKLDHKLNWRVPVCTIVFPLLALSISLYQLMRTLNNKKNG